MTNILLIEDNEIDRFIAERQLALSGVDASMQSADNGKLAMELITSQFFQTGMLPDVILVDNFMPVMSGLDFITAFANVDMAGKENIRIYLVTSLTDIRMKIDPARFGITGILEKPVTSEGFRQIVLQANGQERPQL